MTFFLHAIIDYVIPRGAQRARLEGRAAPAGRANASVSARSFCLVDRMNFLRAVAFALSLAVTGAGFAADPVEPAGPPLSAAPPRAAAPHRPASPPRTAEAEAATYERCMK